MNKIDRDINFYTIVNLAKYVDNWMDDKGLSKNEVVLNIDDPKLFLKIDEDIFYRMYPNRDDFVHSDSDIIMQFENFKLTIKLNEKDKEEEKGEKTV